MIVSDTYNFASRISRDLDNIQQIRQHHIEKLSSGRKVEKSSDDIGALSNKIVQESAMETWNNKKEFAEVLLKNKQLNKIIKNKDIENRINSCNNLKNINWIFKNKIK